MVGEEVIASEIAKSTAEVAKAAAQTDWKVYAVVGIVGYLIVKSWFNTVKDSAKAISELPKNIGEGAKAVIEGIVPDVKIETPIGRFELDWDNDYNTTYYVKPTVDENKVLNLTPQQIEEHKESVITSSQGSSTRPSIPAGYIATNKYVKIGNNWERIYTKDNKMYWAEFDKNKNSYIMKELTQEQIKSAQVF